MNRGHVWHGSLWNAARMGARGRRPRHSDRCQGPGRWIRTNGWHVHQPSRVSCVDSWNRVCRDNLCIQNSPKADIRTILASLRTHIRTKDTLWDVLLHSKFNELSGKTTSCRMFGIMANISASVYASSWQITHTSVTLEVEASFGR